MVSEKKERVTISLSKDLLKNVNVDLQMGGELTEFKSISKFIEFLILNYYENCINVNEFNYNSLKLLLLNHSREEERITNKLNKRLKEVSRV